MAILRQLRFQYSSPLAFQTFRVFSAFSGLTPTSSELRENAEEQVEVRIVQTVISGAGMGVMNILPYIHSSARSIEMNMACRERRCACQLPQRTGASYHPARPCRRRVQ